MCQGILGRKNLIGTCRTCERGIWGFGRERSRKESGLKATDLMASCKSLLAPCAMKGKREDKVGIHDLGGRCVVGLSGELSLSLSHSPSRSLSCALDCCGRGR